MSRGKTVEEKLNVSENCERPQLKTAMQFEWSTHSSELIEEISKLLCGRNLTDVTLTAEGRTLKAHRLVLAAASTFFKELLTSDLDDKLFRNKSRQKTRRQSCDDEEDENKAPTTPNKKCSSSVPASFEETNQVEDTHTQQLQKKRKLQTRSLNRLNAEEDFINAPPLSPVKLPPFWSNTPSVFFPQDIRQYDEYNNTPNHSSTVSYPDELAAKGATLLHHLALCLIREKEEEEEERLRQEAILKQKEDDDKLFKPPIPPKIKSHPKAPLKENNSLTRTRGGSEFDRPDSGFDSKDEGSARGLCEEKESGGGTSSSSPEGQEITRQAPIRQPIFRKRRILH
ncbi:unnamed protein product [Lepeophtheirus salmonis]|uniref:(salmon louse) hypothetical protein n=1 Tax=Lepeophtheirus salmonis TaxID=72036 RepID=A0A7R8D279_LEPSM|nr:unnamed protein product [Lepeophtheirus salmonis]CAF2998516.1 unnamed protein product [Lepeophtheirus salmonis]